MSRLDLSSIPVLTGTGYPDPFAEAVNGRSKQALGDAGGLTQFGVNLVTDEGETLMRAGDCAAFPAGRPNGHQLINRGWGNALFLCVGSRIPDDKAHYPDIDLVYDGKTDSYAHRDGTPYPKRDTRKSTMPAAAASIETDEKTLDPRVFRADHGEQAGIHPHEP
jgi:uncharacterized cupin superfamily protein